MYPQIAALEITKTDRVIHGALHVVSILMNLDGRTMIDTQR